MARPRSAAATLLVVALALTNRSTPASAQGNSSAPASASPTSRSQTQQPVNDRVRREIEQLRARPEGSRVPPADSFTLGPRAVPAAGTLPGPISGAEGTLDVYGRLDGSAYVLNGDIVVHGGGVITGDAMSI